MNNFDIEKILAQIDVEELIAIGAPPNEYAAEAEELANKIQHDASFEDVENAVAEVFHQNFDYGYKVSDKPDDSLIFTKHARTKIRFASGPEGVSFEIVSKHDEELRRATRVHDAAKAIFQLLEQAHKKNDDA